MKNETDMKLQKGRNLEDKSNASIQDIYSRLYLQALEQPTL